MAAKVASMIDRRTFGVGLLSAGAFPNVLRLASEDARIGLNHLYAILDASTAHAIDNASLLHRVASVSNHATVAADGRHWTGRYVHLRRQYLEFFAVGEDSSQGARGEGSVGFALGADHTGDLRRLQTRLTNAGEQTDFSPIRRQVAGKDVAWFQALAISNPQPELRRGSPALVAWAMEYDAAAFASAEPPAVSPPTPDDVVSRLRYNATKYHGSQLSDVAGITVAVSRAAFDSVLRPLLAAAGWGLSDAVDSTTARGPEHEVVFLFAPNDRVGLREVRFRLREPVSDVRQETIGHSSFTVGPGKDARWRFDAR